MNDIAPHEAYGTLIEPSTLQIQRLLPGPIERVWSYLTESDLRRKWLASGKMDMKSGTSFKLTWRNNELTDPPGQPPEGFGEEHSMESKIIELDPPRKLAFSWGDGSVSIALEPKGSKVLLTLVHTRLDDPKTRLMVAAGWHMHLNLLLARIADTQTEPFWDGWTRLKEDYGRRLPI